MKLQEAFGSGSLHPLGRRSGAGHEDERHLQKPRQVSWLCAEIDEKVKVFLQRPIEGDWPYLWIHATYFEIRQNRRIVSVAVIVAVGVNGDGRNATNSLRKLQSETNVLLADNRNSG